MTLTSLFMIVELLVLGNIHLLSPLIVKISIELFDLYLTQNCS